MDKDSGLRVLAGSPWLAPRPQEFREIFLAMARWHRADTGAVITLAGEEADDMIGLADGTAALIAAQGRADTPIMHLVRAPFWMGYGPMLLGKPRVVTAIARSPVLFASFPKAKIVPLLESRPGWWRPFTALLGEYGDLSALIAADLLIPNSEARCAAVLLRFGRARFPGPADADEIEVPVSQDELALAANLSRNSAGSILRVLSADGLVRTGYRTIIIQSPAALRARVERP
jgi:CRP-like cAMP-binding protein